MSSKNRKRQEAKDLQGKAQSENKVPEPKMNIKAKILDGNTIEKKEVVDKLDKQMIENKKSFASKKEERKNVGWVISRLDEPKDVEYNGNVMRISPRAKQKIADHTKLGKLPTGLVLKK
jgi:hypothetical protein